MNTTENSEHKPVPVFWTGGWDSSFRVLDLILQYGVAVQPIYVIPNTRRTTELEIQAMDRIRYSMTVTFPHKATMLLDTIYLKESAIQTPDLAQHPFKWVAEKHGTGMQYLYLSKVKDVTGFTPIEVSVQPGDNLTKIEFLRQRIAKFQYSSGATTNVLTDWEPASDYERGLKLLVNFSFPTFFMPPEEMTRIAKEYNFLKLLDFSWTCHMPFRGEPCGMCSICIYAIEAGKLRIYPESALTRYKYRRLIKPIHLFCNNPKGTIHAAIRKVIKW